MEPCSLIKLGGGDKPFVKNYKSFYWKILALFTNNLRKVRAVEFENRGEKNSKLAFEKYGRFWNWKT